MAARPEIAAVVTHLEPLTEEVTGSAPARLETREYGDKIRKIVRKATGAPPRSLRFVSTEEGLVAYLIVALDPESPLAEAHERASEIESSVHRSCPGIKQLIVHTEP
jgi:divalent metal cation (Fe/Co/Zn/Cd) transporter